MKKTLLISKLMLVFLLFTAWNVSAQDYHITEGFPVGSLPDGWSAKDVSYSSSGTNAANMVFTDETYCAKMKTNNTDAWLQMPKVNGVTDLKFWCKVKDPSLNPHVTIQTSTDGTTWTDNVTDPAGLDLTNGSDFQEVTVPLNIDGEIIVRIYVIADAGGTSSTGMLCVDDIHLGKPAAAADDVLLSSLTVDSTMIDGFDFNVLAYTMQVSHAMAYTVQAETNNPNATYVITQVSDINGDEAARTATIVVTGEDGTSTATTTIVFTITDYWYKEGFDDVNDLPGWETHGTFTSANIKVDPLNQYDGIEAIKFTRGHETGNNAGDLGFILSPKLIDVGTFTFWVAAETVNPLHEIYVHIKTSDTDSTEVFSLKGDVLTTTWQLVEVEINETTDSIQIRITGVCDINDAGDSRIWMDDFLLTYYEEPVIGVDDATLAGLSVGGSLIAGFDAGVTSYTMDVSPIMDYTVTAETTNENATTVITQVSNISGTEAERTATVVVTAEDGTTTATTTVVFTLTGVGVESDKAALIGLYPNPATETLNIQVPEDSYQRLEIFNMAGQNVMQKAITSTHEALNIESLSKGLYIISLSGEAGTHRAKFIKE